MWHDDAGDHDAVLTFDEVAFASAMCDWVRSSLPRLFHTSDYDAELPTLADAVFAARVLCALPLSMRSPTSQSFPGAGVGWCAIC